MYRFVSTVYNSGPNSRFGIHVVMPGMSVIKSKTAMSGMRNGIVAFVTRSNETFATFETTYKTIPTGGVNNPIIKFKIIMIPNCVGLTPSACISGIKIGVRIMMAAFASMNMPTKSRNALMSSKMTTG